MLVKGNDCIKLEFDMSTLKKRNLQNKRSKQNNFVPRAQKAENCQKIHQFAWTEGCLWICNHQGSNGISLSKFGGPKNFLQKFMAYLPSLQASHDARLTVGK